MNLRRLGLILSVLSVLVLVGCESSNDDTDNEAEAAEEEAAEEEAAEEVNLSGRWLVSGAAIPSEATITHDPETGDVTLTDAATGLGEVTLTGSADLDASTFSARIEIPATSTFYEYTLVINSATAMSGTVTFSAFGGGEGETFPVSLIKL